jgi:DNA-binding NarL/FixJ family response regulator
MRKNKIKVGIIASNKIFGDGLISNLNKLDKTRIVFVANENYGLNEELKNHPCELLFVVNNLPVLEFIKTTELILSGFPSLNIILIGISGYENHIDDIIDAGVKGIISIPNCHKEISKSIDMITNGYHFFCEEVIKCIYKANKNKNKDKLQYLTKREIEILRFLVSGLTINEIANKLFIAYKTVENHWTNIKGKTGIKDITSYKNLVLNKYN